MSTDNKSLPRRNFLRTSLALGSGLATIGAFAHENASAPEHYPPSLFVIGPLEGYSPHIGTLVSMLNYNRDTIIKTTDKLTLTELDYLHDPKSNTIAALLMHLAAVEKWYQVNSFEGRDFNEEEKKVWGPGLELGEEGRKTIKGKEWKYYGDILAEVRAKSLAEFKKRDDKWLLAIDPKFSDKEQFNTYWKWFHVCEHESNHRGQITWYKKRLPGAKDTGE